MRFALLGEHPDGLYLARALAHSGRHELLIVSGSAVGAEYLRRWDVHFRTVSDLEEVLADPAVDAVIVASNPSVRAAQLRRTLQSERHVLCVHPADQSPDLGYEAAMLQSDSGYLLLPLLPDAMHPALQRLAEILSSRSGDFKDSRNAEPASTSLNSFRLVEFERWSTEAVLLDAGFEGHKPGLPGWDVLRFLGGEIAEVSAFSVPEEVVPDEPIVITGRFERGGMFQTLLVPDQAEARWRLSVLTRDERIELTFPLGWPGPATLHWLDAAGETRQESWDAWDPWSATVEALEAALGERLSSIGERESAVAITNSAVAERAGPISSRQPPVAAYRMPTWHDAIRILELDDAARRSIERRRSSTLEYQEATEEAGFKGTMTLVGCGLLWSSLFLLILSVWIPWLGWAILPVFALFLGLQLFRWIVPAPQAAPPPMSQAPDEANELRV